ncbi:MAG: hypothetical protein JKX97_06985 [Candidatus Lindowbacteria bacterium]|nr:hypothetical protein [Candidatus Lindowbacteria bacterium]
MRVLVLLDPPEKLNPSGDTSLVIIKELIRKKFSVFACEHEDLGVFNGTPTPRAYQLSLSKSGKPKVESEASKKKLDSFEIILFRQDPPFNLSYLHATQLIDLSGVKIVANSTRGLRAANEKIYALRFSDSMPDTIVSRNKKEILHFVKTVGTAVLKPLDSFGGIGVVLARKSDKGTPAIIDMMTREGADQILAQRFVKGIDKRIFVIGGEVKGVMDRIGLKSDFRANMHVGGQPRLGTLTKTEKVRLEPVLECLKNDGIYFAGLDLIGGYLSEVNVTSPTGFYHYRKISGVNLAEAFVSGLFSITF